MHYNLKVLPETLFLTVNLMDRYLAKVDLRQENLQLLTVAAMLIATKYEEIYPPLLKDLVHITENSCSAVDILDMEKDILMKLDFDI